MDKAVFRIPAVTKGSPPYQVHVPYALISDQFEWQRPTEEELNEDDLD